MALRALRRKHPPPPVDALFLALSLTAAPASPHHPRSLRVEALKRQQATLEAELASKKAAVELELQQKRLAMEVALQVGMGARARCPGFLRVPLRQARQARGSSWTPLIACGCAKFELRTFLT